jgi:hypothetical protein
MADELRGKFVLYLGREVCQGMFEAGDIVFMLVKLL